MPLDKKNKRILVICPHPVGYVPGQRLKFEQYFESWRANGYEVDVSSFMSESLQNIVYLKGNYLKKIAGTIGGYGRRFIDLFSIPKYDVVYVFLWATPFGPPITEFLLTRLARKVIYDIDDLVYQGHTSPNNKIIAFLKSSSKVRFLMSNADRVLVSTDKLYSYTNQFTKNITIIPATIDVKKYNDKPAKIDAVVNIGWSGSHSTSKYLHLLDNVLKKISTMHNIKILVMGDKDFVIDGVDIELLTWSAEDEITNLLKFDIGLHPLPDEEWVYGKSGGKLVQYMAAGIPIIASAIGPNFKVISEGYNGFLVSTEDEWMAKLELLIKDAHLRKTMGQNSKQLAIEKYSIEANADKYLFAFAD